MCIILLSRERIVADFVGLPDGTFDHKGYSEKALHRMVKAKTKADRAAARAAQQTSVDPSASSSNVPSRAVTPVNGASTSAPAEEEAATPAEIPNAEAANEMPEVQPAVAAPSVSKDTVVERSELLRSKSDVVNHFMNLMAPILVDVYAASVSAPVRVKSLTGLLKAICFLESEQLVRILKVRIPPNELILLTRFIPVCTHSKLHKLYPFFQGSS